MEYVFSYFVFLNIYEKIKKNCREREDGGL